LSTTLPLLYQLIILKICNHIIIIIITGM